MGQVHALQGKGKNDPTLISRKITNGCRLVYYFDHNEKKIVIVQHEGHYSEERIFFNK
jgi:Txe/YoeB family toxin of Txe-Axe toxin-antitoxin module